MNLRDASTFKSPHLATLKIILEMCVSKEHWRGSSVVEYMAISFKIVHSVCRTTVNKWKQTDNNKCLITCTKCTGKMRWWKECKGWKMTKRALKFYLLVEQDCNIYEFTTDEITCTRLEQDQASWIFSTGKGKIAKIPPLFEDLLAVDRCWEGELLFWDYGQGTIVHLPVHGSTLMYIYQH